VRDVALQGLLLVERWRAGVVRAGAQVLRGEAQRFGAQTFERVSARWPALAELVHGFAGDPWSSTHATAYEHGRPIVGPGPITLEVVAATPLATEPAAAHTLLTELAGAPAWQDRASAARRLAHSTAADVVAALGEALRDPSAEVAVAAAEVLGLRAEASALHALSRVLQNHDGYFSPIARVAALRELARRLGPTQLELIVEALRDVDAEVSIAAIAALAERVPQRMAELLLPITRDQSGFFLPIVRQTAVNALARAGVMTPEP